MTEEEQAALEETRMQEAIRLVQSVMPRAYDSDLNSTNILLARLLLAVESK